MLYINTLGNTLFIFFWKTRFLKRMNSENRKHKLKKKMNEINSAPLLMKL